MAFDSAIFILDLFTDLSVYYGTTLLIIKIGTFAHSLNRVSSSEIFLPCQNYLVIMRLSDFGTNFPHLKNSSEIFYASRFYDFNIYSKDFQNNDFSPFSSVNFLNIK